MESRSKYKYFKNLGGREERNLSSILIKVKWLAYVLPLGDRSEVSVFQVVLLRHVFDIFCDLLGFYVSISSPKSMLKTNARGVW